MGNKIIKTVVVILTSVLITALIFLVLTYTGIAPRIIKGVLIISGNDAYQGEDKSPYIFEYILYLILAIFIITFFLTKYFFFKSKK